VIKKIDRNKSRLKRHSRIRGKISGTTECPRLSVFKSNKAVFVQLIDDTKGVTVASVSSKELKLTNNNIDSCTKIGEEIAKKAKTNGIDTVVFDRGGYVYHGKIKAIAEAARKEGLKF